jgi:YVTN family beta-propeller protein
MAFKGGKMYVSAYVGSVATPEMLGSVFEIDTASLSVTREVKVGHQPDELCIVDDKLYVCNSGGYLMNRYDSTLSVIDLNTFTETEKITVGLNPTRIRVDDQKHLWVCCQGNYRKVKPQIVVLDGDEIITRIPTPCANISLLGANAYVLDAENKELKNIAAQLKQQLSEAVLINASLAKVIRLVTENATSRDEKINILNRFNKVKSLNECKSLYTQISAELANAHSVNNNLLNKQLTEAKGQNKNMIVETNMLNQSEDLRQILDLNERLMRLGK